MNTEQYMSPLKNAEFPFYVYSNCMKMYNTEWQQLTAEMKQT